MSLDAMKQALAVLEEIADEVFSPYDNKLGDAIVALRAAIEEGQGLAEKVPARGTILEQTLGKVWDKMPHPDYQKETEQEPMAWFTVNEINEWAAKYLEKHPEQEPVAWVGPSWLNPETRTWESESFAPKPIKGWIPLYTAPRQWQGLTDEELRQAYCEVSGKEWCLGGLANAHTFYDALETKLKEKNNG